MLTMRRLFRVARILAGLLHGVPLAQPGSSSSQSGGYVEFQPLDTVAVAPGKSVSLQFTFHIRNRYYINSSQPTAPELIPTSLGLTSPPDLVVAKVQYPAGQMTSFPFDPTQKLSVYSGDVVVKAQMTAQPEAATGTYTVHGEFRYQACDYNACYPPRKLRVQFYVRVSNAVNGR